MNRKIKWAITASILHLVLFSISNLIYSLGPRYEILGYFTIPAVLYELPLVFVFAFLNISSNISDPNVILLTYTVGTLFYFVLGFLLACFFSFFSEKGKKG